MFRCFIKTQVIQVLNYLHSTVYEGAIFEEAKFEAYLNCTISNENLPLQIILCLYQHILHFFPFAQLTT